MTTTEDYIENMPTKSANLFVWTVTVLFVIVLAGFLLIKQPDVVTGNIRLIAHNQPFELLAPHTGKLMLLKYTNDSVCSSQDIAYISNSADYHTMDSLAVLLGEREYSYIYKTLSNNETVKGLGMLNNSCMTLRSAIYKYMTFHDKSLFEESKRQLETEIATLKEQINLQTDLLEIEQASLKVTLHGFKEDSLLYSKNAITKTDFDRSYKTLLAQQGQHVNAKNTLLAYQKEKIAKELKLQELTIDNTNSTETLQQEVEQAISMLQNDIETWRKQYVITSPIDGMLEIVTSVEDRQIVTQDSPVLRVLPTNKNIMGQMLFTSKEAGEIQDNIPIKIYLDSYPKSQNGYLSGHISDISSSVYIVQDGESFHSAKARIDFDKQPNFHGKFQFVHGMTGQVEIIVKKKNLLMQILNIISSNIK